MHFESDYRSFGGCLIVFLHSYTLILPSDYPPKPPPFHFQPFFFSMFPVSASREVATDEFGDTSFSLQHMDPRHLLSLPLPPTPPPHPPTPARCCFGLWWEERCSRVLSCLTQAGGVKGGVSLALPLPATVAGAQALQQVALRVALAPGVSDPVGGERVLVVAAVCQRVDQKAEMIILGPFG